METTRGERIRLGIFVLSMLLLIFGTAAFLIGQKISEQYVPYYTSFSESVSGLNPGAKVKLNGINVGQVVDLEVDKKNLNNIIVKFEIVAGTPIKTTMTASLVGGISLTGIKSIELSGGDPSDPDVKRNGFIKSSVSGLKQITGQAEDIALKVEGILNNILVITSDRNQEKIAAFIDNLAHLTKIIDVALVKNESEITAIPGITKKILEDMQSVTKDASVVMANAAKAVVHLDSVAVHADKKIIAMPLEQTVNNANSAAKSVELLAKRSDQLVYRNQEDLSTAVRNLREAVENLNDVSRQVRENPSLLIRGENKQQRTK